MNVTLKLHHHIAMLLIFLLIVVSLGTFLHNDVEDDFASGEKAISASVSEGALASEPDSEYGFPDFAELGEPVASLIPLNNVGITVNIYNDINNEGCYIFHATGTGRLNSLPEQWSTYKPNVTVAYIDNGITVIDSYVFRDASSLKDLHIAPTVNSFGSATFSGCSSLENVYITDIDAWCRISNAGSTYSTSSCPLSYADNLYLNGEPVKSVVIPEDVTVICSYMFSFSSLESISLHERVTNIRYSAFNGCENLKTINVPKSVANIDEYAFLGCPNLTEVKINDIASWCSISFKDNYANPLNNGGDLYLNGNKIEQLTIPNGVVTIPRYAFYGQESIKNITIADSVVTIDHYAFSNCINLTTVVMPDSITSIGTYAFSGCTGLENVNISDNLTKIGNYAFSGCSCLSSIIISDGVTEIGDYAFSNCTGLKSITFNKVLNKIGRNAFENCNNLASVHAPDVTSWCNINYTSSYSNPLYYDCELYLNGNLIEDLVIPEGVTTIPLYAFYKQSTIKSVIIENGITSIGAYAFAYCSNIESVVIPESVTNIFAGTFMGCSSMKSVNLPQGITMIYASTFSDCYALKQINIPNGVTTIVDNAFKNCAALSQISIPSSVTTIQNYVFNNCTALTDVNISWGLKYIYTHAFDGCTSLTSITLPGSVVSLGSYAFYGCTALARVTLSENIVNLPYWAFRECENLVSINLPKNLQKIENQAFYGCKKLKEIVIPDSVTTIGYETFARCESIVKVTIGKSVVSLSNNAFYECYNLKLVTILSSTVASDPPVSSELLYYAKTVILPDSITTVGNYVTTNFTLVDALDYVYADGTKVTYNVYSKHSHSANAEAWGEVYTAPGLYKIGFVGHQCSECGFVYGAELPELKPIDGANLTLGVDLSVNIYADVFEDYLKDTKIRVTMNGNSTLLSGEWYEAYGMYKFAFRGVTPQCMGDLMRIELVYCDEVIDVIENYSVRAYCDKVLSLSAGDLGLSEEKHEQFVDLICNLLEYGAEAQIYLGYKTDALVNEGIDGKTEYEELTETDRNLEIYREVDGVYFTAANLRFDNANKLYFKFKAADVSLVTVDITVDGVTKTYGASDFIKDGDAYILYTGYIYATCFDDVYTVVLNYEGEAVESFTYSVKSYVYSKQNQVSGEELSDMARFARATYNYGRSAKIFNGN